MRDKKLLILGVLLLSLLLNAGLGVYAVFHEKHSPEAVLKNNVKEFPYLSPRIHINTNQDLIINFTQLRTAINSYVNTTQADVGFYFEYLPTGSSISINPEKEVKLASLAKVPVVMAVYKEIERGNVNPDTIITLKPEHINNSYGALWRQGAGSKVSLDRVIELALQDSDNTAALAIASLLPETAMDEVFDQVDLPKKETAEEVPVLNGKGYSSILRNLYLATYLNKEHSNEIIELLTNSKTNDLLPVGIPDTIKVAHKIGVYEIPNQEENTYSDCGIVYVPNRPYLICIMAEEKEAEASEHIINLSKLVYDYVSGVSFNSAE